MKCSSVCLVFKFGIAWVIMGLGDAKWSIQLMAANEALPRLKTDRVQPARTPKCLQPMAVNARQIETQASLLGCGRPILLRLDCASPLIKISTPPTRRIG